MLYGIQITKSVILNKIAAEIDENIKQVKVEMRLCHHLAFKDRPSSSTTLSRTEYRSSSRASGSGARNST